MADALRKAQITAELVQLTQQQKKDLEDAIYLGWLPGKLEAYQERGEQITLLRQQLNVVVIGGKIIPLPDTLPTNHDFDAERS